MISTLIKVINAITFVVLFIQCEQIYGIHLIILYNYTLRFNQKYAVGVNVILWIMNILGVKYLEQRYSMVTTAVVLYGLETKSLNIRYLMILVVVLSGPAYLFYF